MLSRRLRASAATLVTMSSVLLFRATEARCQTQRGHDAAATVAIEHVTVLPMTGVGALADTTVVIAGERILRIGNSATIKLPKSVRRVNGSGQWLLPALTDMHVHIAARPPADLPYGAREVLAPFVANGVLQIVDLASNPDTNQVRDRIAKGELDGPRMATCHMVDGDPPLAGSTATVVRSKADAERVVFDIEHQGYDYIKVYSNLALDSFQGILDAARARGVRVLGHFPGAAQSRPADVLLPGFALVAHAEEFAWHDFDWSDEEIARHAQLMRARGTALTTTLYLNEQIAAQTRSLDGLENVEGLTQVNPAELPQWFESNRYAARSSPERIRVLSSTAEWLSSTRCAPLRTRFSPRAAELLKARAVSTARARQP